MRTRGTILHDELRIETVQDLGYGIFGYLQLLFDKLKAVRGGSQPVLQV